MAVRIDSGPVNATDYIYELPPDKWPDLVQARRNFIEINLNYDCRCLVQFVKDAEEMWQRLGYSSPDDLIANGYDLEPEEIRLAVRWLELNKPEEVISLPEVCKKAGITRKEKTIEAAKANPEAARDKPGNPTGVNQHTERNCVEDEKQHNSSTKGHGSTNVPYRLKVLRRDHPDIAARLDAGEFDSVAEAERVARGEPAKVQRRTASVLEQTKRLVGRMTPEERQEFLAWIASL